MLSIKNNPNNPKNYSLIAQPMSTKGRQSQALEMVKTSLKMNADETTMPLMPLAISLVKIRKV